MTAVFGQLCRAPVEMRPVAENTGFMEGTLGAFPPGWYLGPQQTPDYAAEIASGAACHTGLQCGVVRSVRDNRSGNLAFLYQIVDASPHRGEILTFRAAVRADVTDGSVARLLVRIHRNDCTTSFRDDMGDHPVTANSWNYYQITSPIVVFDARDIEFGMQLIGHGTAWIDNITLTFTTPSIR